MANNLTPMTLCDKKLFFAGKQANLATAKARAMDSVIHAPMNAAQSQAALKMMFGDNYTPLTDADRAWLDAERKAEDRETQAQLVETQYRNSGVPRKFYDVELDALFTNKRINAIDIDKTLLTKTRAETFIQSAAKGRPQSMWLCGEAGTGKTALACAIMHELVRRGVKCKYFKSHEIMTRLDNARTRASCETRTSIMADVTSCSLVVIDEVARWPNAEWEKFMLFSLTDSNYDSFRSAIYIGNMNAKEFADYMGNAVTDRGRGQCMSFSFSGLSLRGSKGELYTE